MSGEFPLPTWWRGFTALLSQCVSFSLIDIGRVSSAYIVFFLVLLARIHQGSCPGIQVMLAFGVALIAIQ
eukprot:557650-Pelagomonas_calceolata.AAC.2